jgi:hypothetical protein
MHSFVSALVIVLWGLISVSTPPVFAATKDAKHFIVDIIAINGEEFKVRDEGGVEGKIHVGADTEKYGQFQPGDRIDAWVYPNGDAKTVMILRSAKIIEEDRQQEAQQRHKEAEQQHQAQR